MNDASNTSRPKLIEQLLHCLEGFAPQTPLIVSDNPTLAQAITAWPNAVWNSAALRKADHTLPRTDLAIIDGDLPLSSAGANALLSAMRDVYADRVIVIAASQADAPINRERLVGLGFYRYAVSDDAGITRRWYAFDLADYKVTPDWLSPRHWANPELWDKFRW